MNNKIKQNKNDCQSVRNSLFLKRAAEKWLQCDWVQSHIATCPRCQKRMAGASRVELALSLIKNQPHKTDLLSLANQKTVGKLKHSLRFCGKAERLKCVMPKPSGFVRLSRCSHAVANLAACLVIVVLLKTHIFPSVQQFQNDGQIALRDYYTCHVGKEIADDIFRT